MKLAIWLSVLFLFISLVNVSSAEIISLDPCAGETIITEDATKIYASSGCFDVVFTKVYNGTPISFYDKYNKDAFDLKLYSLQDTNVANPNQKKTTSFETLGMIGTFQGNSIVYHTADWKIRLNYTIEGNSVKAGLYMSNWVSNYAQGSLKLRTRIHKEDTAQSHFVNTPAEVDGVMQPLVVSEEVNGVNKFFVQTLFTGHSFTQLIQDPIYYVDYDPIPAISLITGDVRLDDDGEFSSLVNVTASVSDNNTGTYATTFEGTSLDIPYSLLKDAGASNETNKVIAIDGTNIEINTDFSAGKFGALVAEAGHYFTNGTIITFYTKPKDASATNKIVKFVNVAGTITLGSYNTGTDTTNYGYKYITLSNVPKMTSTIRFYENTPADNFKILIDYIDIDIYDTNQGSALATHFSTTFDSDYDYFLTIYETLAGTNTFYAYAYLDANTPSTQFESKVVSSTGFFTMNVTDLVDYQTNTLGLPYTSFRIFTDSTQQIAEVFLRKEKNDTEAPIITNCQTNDSTLDCGESALLSCNITDNLDVDEGYFEINGTNYTAIQFVDTFVVNFSPTQSGLYDWTDVYAVDLVNQLSTFDPNIQITQTCCIEDWQPDINLCQTDDTQLISYTDLNGCGSFDDLPLDNGTTTACNYCSENLTKNYTSICHKHLDEGIIDFIWTDANYYSCCALTGLVSDCSVDYPPLFNTTFNESCIFTINEFEIQADIEALFGFGFGGLASDKVSGKIYINDTNATYYCVSYVKTAEGDIVQTNPPYTKRTESTISIIPKEIEDREFFITKNGLANVYWTDHNLIKDEREYIFGVECASEDNRLISELVMKASYKSVNEPITRWVWIKNNVLGLTIIFFIILLVILVGGWLWNQR